MHFDIAHNSFDQTLSEVLKSADISTDLGCSLELYAHPHVTFGSRFLDTPENPELLIPLKDLVLTSIQFDTATSLVNFIKTSKRSLRSLQCHIVGVRSGSWREVFTFLLREVQLESLFVQSILENDYTLSLRPVLDRMGTPIDQFDLLIDCSEGENIQRWLELLAADHIYGSHT